MLVGILFSLSNALAVVTRDQESTTIGVDAARAIILGRDVMTVVEVTAFSGLWDSVVPAVAVLVALDLTLGAVAITRLRRATSSDVE